MLPLRQLGILILGASASFGAPLVPRDVPSITNAKPDTATDSGQHAAAKGAAYTFAGVAIGTGFTRKLMEPSKISKESSAEEGPAPPYVVFEGGLKMSMEQHAVFQGQVEQCAESEVENFWDGWRSYRALTLRMENIKRPRGTTLQQAVQAHYRDHCSKLYLGIFRESGNFGAIRVPHKQSASAPVQKKHNRPTAFIKKMEHTANRLTTWGKRLEGLATHAKPAAEEEFASRLLRTVHE